MKCATHCRRDSICIRYLICYVEVLVVRVGRLRCLAMNASLMRAAASTTAATLPSQPTSCHPIASTFIPTHTLPSQYLPCLFVAASINSPLRPSASQSFTFSLAPCRSCHTLLQEVQCSCIQWHAVSCGSTICICLSAPTCAKRFPLHSPPCHSHHTMPTASHR